MSVRRYGNILVYPATGRLMFVTDFHGQVADLRRAIARFTARLARGEDIYLLFAGDFVHGPAPGQVTGWLQKDESIAVLDELVPFLEAHPERVHSLLGNHEHGHLGGVPTRKFYRGIEDDVSALEERLGPHRTEAVRALFSTFALLALAPCGVMFTHAAPDLDPTHPDLLRTLASARLDQRDPVLLSLLWPRAVQSRERMQAIFEALRFKGIHPRIAAYGHEIAPRGVDRSEPDQVVVSSSFAVADRYKTFLDVDLSAAYSSVADLREGIELVRLYPERAIGRPPSASSASA